MKRRFFGVVTSLMAVTLLLSGCSAATQTDSGGGEVQQTTLTVFAAASLEPTFTELAQTFEEEHAGVKVRFNFAGSQTLQEQIIEGAPADVFASANTQQMGPVVGAGLNATYPTVFATNTLMIVTPPDNPSQIKTLTDLTQAGINLVICAPEVPCGAATEKIENLSGLTFSPVSEEQSVTDVLAKVQVGEADVGLVYKTDAISAGDTVAVIPFAESAEALNENVIVSLSTGKQADLGQQWVDFILSPSVQKALQEAGFGPAE